DREAQPLLVVRDAGDPVLPPAVGARAGVVVREILPRLARVAVVLAHGAPLPLREVGVPPLPGEDARVCLLEPALLGARHRRPHAGRPARRWRLRSPTRSGRMSRSAKSQGVASTS